MGFTAQALSKNCLQVLPLMSPSIYILGVRRRVKSHQIRSQTPPLSFLQSGLAPKCHIPETHSGVSRIYYCNVSAVMSMVASCSVLSSCSPVHPPILPFLPAGDLTSGCFRQPRPSSAARPWSLQYLQPQHRFYSSAHLFTACPGCSPLPVLGNTLSIFLRISFKGLLGGICGG